MNLRLTIAMLAITSVSVAADQKYAPLPEKLIKAQTAYLQNDTGEQKLTDNMFTNLERWGRWRVVTSRSDADIVISLDHKNDFRNNFFMRVLDRESGETLWTGKRDVAIGTMNGVTKALLDDLKKRLPPRPSTK